MSVTENKKVKTIENADRFFDYMEWSGRIPSTKSPFEYERKLSFWLVHMKQARKGIGTCIWYDELLDKAERHGVPGLFDVDTRTIHYCNSLYGQQFGPYTVVDKSDSLTQYGQESWVCLDKSEELVEVSTFVLLRIKSNPRYIHLFSKIREFSGKQLGVWKILGVIGFEGVNKNSPMRSRPYKEYDEVETSLMCSRPYKGYDEVKRIVLPSFSTLSRYFAIKKYKKVSPIQSVWYSKVDESLGIGVEDMTAKQCNSWEVIGYSHRASNNECVWMCVCECGEFSKVAGGKLRNGSSKSCGCLRKKLIDKEKRELLASQAAVSVS